MKWKNKEFFDEHRCFSSFFCFDYDSFCEIAKFVASILTVSRFLGPKFKVIFKWKKRQKLNFYEEKMDQTERKWSNKENNYLLITHR